ncbi:S41 family peptidase [Patescibacteria group bacterium]|nr:S41 family peptidase [Patescibacteria group bacterium]MBU1682604.1 S41 family peptidase [Patescibacteria group bacterium]MBU1935657.1 S41 family peptidase [Patescibacteria group bacterium]
MKSPYFKKESTAPKYIGFLILIIFVFILGWNVGVNHTYRAEGINAQNTVISPYGEAEMVNMQLFWDTWNILSSKYVDPHTLDAQEMIFGAIEGMVDALGDPYTTFMTPKENKEFQDSLEGTLEGIGAELTLRHGLLTVISPLKNSPAKEAGLQPEDVIYMVDGQLTDEMTLEQAVMRIRGEKGTAVVLTILRKDYNEPIDITIVRDTININSVDWEMEGDIAIIEINQFGNNTKTEFSKAINDVLNQRPIGIVLDLRYNGGGYLDGAVDIVSEFIEEGEVVTIKKRNPEEDEIIYVNGQARVVNTPLVVLINKGSASASEIVAGAIQDHERGIIIGETSFGKGTVQEVENLIGGSSLRVTIAKWFTPSGTNISEVGITPDIIVERTSDDYENDDDPQLDAAIEYIQNGTQQD